jgi:hypothetical protein
MLVKGHEGQNFMDLKMFNKFNRWGLNYELIIIKPSYS